MAFAGGRAAGEYRSANSLTTTGPPLAAPKIGASSSSQALANQASHQRLAH